MVSRINRLILFRTTAFFDTRIVMITVKREAPGWPGWYLMTKFGLKKLRPCIVVRRISLVFPKRFTFFNIRYVFQIKTSILNGQALSPFAAAAGQNIPPGFGLHPFAETMHSLSAAHFWLVCSLHFRNLNACLA